MTYGFQLGRALYVDPDSAGAVYAGGVIESARGSGDELAIQAALNGASVTDLLWWRNLAQNRDEPIVPFVSAQRPDLDGFYRVKGTDTEVSGDLSNGMASVSAALQRIPASRYPRIEVLSHGKLRTNINSVTDANVTACIGVPTAGVDSLDQSTIGSVATKTRSEATLVLTDTLFGPSAGKPAVCAYNLDPSDYYDGAPVLMLPDLSTGEWRPMIGRPVSSGLEGWQIVGTGFTIEGGVDSSGVLEMSIDDQPLYIGSNAGASGLDLITASPIGFAVLRNSPEMVSIRVTLAGGLNRSMVTVTVRRGQRHASINLVNCQQVVGLSVSAGLWLPESSGATDLNGGVRMNTAVGGNRYWLGCTTAETSSSPSAGPYAGVVYGLEDSAASSLDVDNLSFSVGVETAGSGASGEDTAQNCIYQWYAAMTERQVVTGL